MRLTGLLLLSFLLAVSSCRTDPPAVNAGILLNQTYGPNERNRMDVYLPHQHDSTTCMVMLIHGGGWVAGDKSNWASDFVSNLTENGFAVSSINYRYACGDFHKQMEDIQLAVDYINSNYASWSIARNKFAFIGGSAGGHLALLYAHAFDSVHIAKAVVSLVGPTDLTDTVFQKYAANYGIGYVFESLLGSSFESNPQVYADASPLFHCSNVPSLFIHGALDDLVPPAQGVKMFDSLTVRGVATDTTFFGNAGHDVFGPNQVNKVQVYNEIKHWLQLYLR